MYVGNTRAFAWGRDLLIAVVASVLGYSTAGVLWTGEWAQATRSFFELRWQEWLVMTAVLFVPSAALGLLAGGLAGWFWPRDYLGSTVAGVTAFAVSTGTTLAFAWWLSTVM